MPFDPGLFGRLLGDLLGGLFGGPPEAPDEGGGESGTATGLFGGLFGGLWAGIFGPVPTPTQQPGSGGTGKGLGMMMTGCCCTPCTKRFCLTGDFPRYIKIRMVGVTNNTCCHCPEYFSSEQWVGPFVEHADATPPYCDVEFNIGPQPADAPVFEGCAESDIRPTPCNAPTLMRIEAIKIDDEYIIRAYLGGDADEDDYAHKYQFSNGVDKFACKELAGVTLEYESTGEVAPAHDRYCDFSETTVEILETSLEPQFSTNLAPQNHTFSCTSLFYYPFPQFVEVDLTGYTLSTDNCTGGGCCGDVAQVFVLTCTALCTWQYLDGSGNGNVEIGQTEAQPEPCDDITAAPVRIAINATIITGNVLRVTVYVDANGYGSAAVVISDEFLLDLDTVVTGPHPKCWADETWEVPFNQSLSDSQIDAEPGTCPLVCTGDRPSSITFRAIPQE